MKFKTILIFIMVLIFETGFAQEKYYKIIGQTTLNELQFANFEKDLISQDKNDIYKIKTDVKKDSIINYYKIESRSLFSNGFDPYSDAKKLIGMKFPIENYKDAKGNFYTKDFMVGKPTIINFWFTKCMPCVEEMPILNSFSEKFGDKVNFISITFNSEKEVQEFLKTHPYDFLHITNSKDEIEKLKISAYPTTLFLDKDGIIKLATGEISEFEIKEIDEVLKVLL
ncbi:TlpA family protein disulfide reductase [Frigoriflavimonas asaccharolytica]|uniref:Thiol-disulfide isomerase/thioredoxin n=1 Tax=Frigoriflavimonas asaccharolytica TaxID=2735899 RepID=A0A8J8K9M7_9FLAO|nr:TlpA disulfide reductase family protein [Frigoriflavimonas asaccharolytica]NRS93948.1 thiol-disulfide isomerase/thioredoxin [Frigoriflavimonas asaccharolytica]